MMATPIASVVRYAGTYRFGARAILERALAKARAHLDDEDELAALGGGWLRCFVMSDTTLTVNLAIPALPDHQIAAAEVFAALAREAVDGSVRATIDDISVDEFISGDDDD